MVRKKGVYDIIYFETKANPETVVSGVNWKQVLEKLASNYMEYVSVKDVEHAKEPFIKIVSSIAGPPVKEKEEFVYSKRAK